ncbi:MAG: rhodanese-like domain-containing protein [Pseudoclavibacter sp.]|nr:rhodanese-like domain-containing protein [Pseudoclavibacter sp.]
MHARTASLLALTAGCAFALLGCTAPPQDGAPPAPAVSAVSAPAGLAGEAHVDPERFAAAVEQGAILVDVRTPEEFAAGHIAGAVNIPLDERFEASFEALDPIEPYAVYCATGNRSRQALERLTALGFNNVVALEGGFSAWTGPVETGS